MTLEQLAKDISATAEAEAKATIKAAEAEAKTILCLLYTSDAADE